MTASTITRTLAAIAVAASSLLAGCGDDVEEPIETEAPARPSQECVDLLRRASESDDEDVYGDLIDASLEECATVDQWTAALRQHPGALGISEPELADPAVDLAGVCLPRVADTPVCEEAIESGLIPVPAE